MGRGCSGSVSRIASTRSASSGGTPAKGRPAAALDETALGPPKPPAAPPQAISRLPSSRADRVVVRCRRVVGVVLGASEHLDVARLGRHELGVGAVGDDAATFDEHDAVGETDRRQPVRDHERRAAGEQRAERVVDVLLDLHVDGARRVVEDQHRRVGEQRAGDRDALALPTRQVVAPLADDGVVAIGQVVDELVGVRRPCGRLDVVGSTRPDARRRCCRGSRPRRGRARRARLRRSLAGWHGEVADVVPVDEDLAAVDVVEPGTSRATVDFPLPVRPTIATVSPASDVQVEVREDGPWVSAPVGGRRT